jgi:hypothetical protein
MMRKILLALLAFDDWYSFVSVLCTRNAVLLALSQTLQTGNHHEADV